MLPLLRYMKGCNRGVCLGVRAFAFLVDVDLNKQPVNCKQRNDFEFTCITLKYLERYELHSSKYKQKKREVYAQSWN